jgi:hypothetical protein
MYSIPWPKWPGMYQSKLVNAMITTMFNLYFISDLSL